MCAALIADYEYNLHSRIKGLQHSYGCGTLSAAYPKMLYLHSYWVTLQ